MAQRRRVELLDDFDPEEEAVETVTFDYKGRGPFEIDLSQENLDEFDELIEQYIAVARRVGGDRVRGSARRAAAPKASGDYDLAAVRQWASENGYTVSGRGRVAKNILEAYEAAHAA